ncbi:MAG TPA: hypothetical protein VD789_08675 [Thermomicrobiales bacterium]|nr:hypothetical protein [Thermomicrobiales bacterium]
MSGLNEGLPDRPVQSIARQAGDVIRQALSGRHGLGILVAMGIVVIAGLVAPGAPPGAWVWMRVLTVTLLVAFALAAIAGVLDGFPEHRAISPALVWGSLIVAIAISLSLGVLTATLAIIILVLLLVHLSSGHPTQGTVFWTLVATLAPLWVWSAFEAWDRWLLMLIPIGTVGVISLEHALRSGLAGDDESERLAAWIGIVAIGLALLLTTLPSDVDAPWVIAGNVVMAVLAGVDLLVIRRTLRERIPSFALPALALMTLTFSWLIAL